MDAATPPQPTDPSPTLVALVGFVLGTVPVVVRLLPMGPDQRRTSVTVALVGAVVAALAAAPRPSGDRWTTNRWVLVQGIVGVAVVALGTVSATAVVGRVPVVLTGLATALAVVVARRGSVLGLVLLAVHALAWLVLGSNTVALACLVLAGAAAAAGVGPRLTLPERRARERSVDTPRVSAEGWWALGLGLLAGLATAAIFWRLAVDQKAFVRGTNDVNSAVPRIDDLSLWPFRLTVAHPVYFVLIRILQTFLSLAVATTLVASASVAGTVVVLIAIGRSRWDDRTPLRLPLACAYGLSYVLLETVAVFVPRTDDIWGRYPFAGSFARGSGYIGLHLWGTPTVVMATPFTFWTLALLLQVVREADDSSEAARRRRWTLCALTVFLTLLMPGPALVLGPAIAVHLLVRRQPRLRAFVVAARWYLVPAAILVLAEVAFLSSNVSKYEQATWIWDPFWLWHYFGLDRPALYLIYLVVIPCLAAGARDYVRDEAVRVSAMAIVIGVVPFLLLQQTTVASIPDGDLGVPPMMAVWLFVMASLRFLAIRAQVAWDERAATGGPWPRWILVAGVVVGAMAAAGVLDLLGATGVIGET